MAMVVRGAALLAAVLLPAFAAAQAQDGAGDVPVESEPESPPTAGNAAITPPASWVAAGERWAVKEHVLRVVPVEEEQSAEALTGDLPEQRRPAWPNEHLYRGWDFGSSFSYPQVYPNVGARMLSVVGDVNDATNFVSRLEAELYLLHFGVNVVESVGGDRMTDVFVDTDLRIPIRLGPGSLLSLMPGISFPVDEAANDQTTNVRMQAIYAFGAGGVGLQLRGGVTEGIRPAGLLDVDRRLTGTAALYGGLISWRFVDTVQVRVEAAGEIATTEGAPDRLSLLPGVVFFPWGDPRLQLGLTAVIETVSEDLDDEPNVGGLFDVGMFFY